MIQEISDAQIIDDSPEAREILRSERQHFLDEAFLRALPIALTVRDWTRKGEQGTAQVISSQADRIKLAWDIAQESYVARVTVKKGGSDEPNDNKEKPH